MVFFIYFLLRKEMMNVLERYKEGITVSHEKGETKEKRNEKRHEAIEDYFNEHFILNKNQFLSYIKKHPLHQGKDETIEKIDKVDFSKATPRNKPFMNELAFAGQSMTEGFLECFLIERNKALEKYTDQLQVIEKKEDGEPSKFYIGTFIKDKLTRVTPYSDNKEELNEKLKQQEERLAKKQQETKKTKEHSLSLMTRREED